MNAAGSPRGADVVLKGGNILTMDDSRRVAEAVSYRAGRLLAVGSNEEVAATAYEGSTIVDLKGRTVIPGMVDAHTHVELTTYSRHFWTDVRDLHPTEVLKRITELAATRAPGEWIVMQGTFGQNLPGRRELDRAAPHHPVAVRWSMHKFQLNSAALGVSGITRRSVAPPGVRIHHESSGDPSGLIEEGWDLTDWAPPLQAALQPALQETLSELFLRNGVTSVHEVVASTAGMRAYQDLAKSGTIPRMGLALTARPGHQALVDTRDFSSLGFQSGFGDARCYLQAVKIFLDGGRNGAFRSSDMALPARDWGLLTRTPQALAQELAAAADAGVQTWVHAIGDLAQEGAVSAIEQVARAHPGLDHRTRIEHFANEIFDTGQLKRLVEAGGLAVPNPGFVWSEPDDPALRLPPGATKYAVRTLRDIAGRVPGNSDTAGAQPFTTNPWFVMKCMVLQQNRNGVVVSPEETCSVAEALESFTRDAAFATFQERDKGTLEVGKLADLAVLNTDPLGVSPESLDSIRTEATVIGGDVVFGRF
jgi:predicted amidohydrolase YtcJ